MIRHPATYIRLGLFALIVVATLSYGLFQMWNLIEGPVIIITTPLNGAAVARSLIPIEGTTRNISHISMNDRPIFIDEKGGFGESVLLSYGYNTVTLKARDKFGREIRKTLELIYK